jgi:hypothetical protein
VAASEHGDRATAALTGRTSRACSHAGLFVGAWLSGIVLRTMLLALASGVDAVASVRDHAGELHEIAVGEKRIDLR